MYKSLVKPPPIRKHIIREDEYTASDEEREIAALYDYNLYQNNALDFEREDKDEESKNENKDEENEEDEDEEDEDDEDAHQDQIEEEEERELVNKLIKMKQLNGLNIRSGSELHEDSPYADVPNDPLFSTYCQQYLGIVKAFKKNRDSHSKFDLGL